MRRAIANSVVLVMLSIFFAPAIAASAPNPVPLCCRRGGAHHCTAVAAASAEGTTFRVDNPCPMHQGPQLGSSVVALPAALSAGVELGHSGRIAAIIPEWYSARFYAEYQRGPPTP
jgi:hypothetical protein